MDDNSTPTVPVPDPVAPASDQGGAWTPPAEPNPAAPAEPTVPSAEEPVVPPAEEPQVPVDEPTVPVAPEAPAGDQGGTGTV